MEAETAVSIAGESSTACPSEASLPHDEDAHDHDALLATISEASLDDEDDDVVNAPFTGEVVTVHRFSTVFLLLWAFFLGKDTRAIFV